MYRVEINKYAHSGSGFSTPLYDDGETFPLHEAIRIADERKSLGVDRFVVIVNMETGRVMSIHEAREEYVKALDITPEYRIDDFAAKMRISGI